jgi:hypothetical protein
VDNDMAALLERDLANVEAGIYLVPADHEGSLLTFAQPTRDVCFTPESRHVQRRKSMSALCQNRTFPPPLGAELWVSSSYTLE